MDRRMQETEWYGYRRLNFDFEGLAACLVCPKEANRSGHSPRWLFKIEYFEAFPSFELAMLERGWYVAHVDNRTRWATPADRAVWPRFCAYLSARWGLRQKCLPVGMSCGGMEAVYFASEHPELVAALYLDAPVMDLLSCPYGMGKSESDFSAEFEAATGLSRSEMLHYRDHPIDRAPALLAARIPVMMVSGDADRTVPYDENGQRLTAFYRENGGVIHEIIKAGGDHHPHGLPDPAPLIEFAEAIDFS